MPTEVLKKNGRAVCYTRNAKGELTEVCALDARGYQTVPILTMNPERESGSIQFKSTSDSYFDGRALATTAFGDDSYDAPMSWAQWRDAYLEWFTRYLDAK